VLLPAIAPAIEDSAMQTGRTLLASLTFVVLFGNIPTVFAQAYPSHSITLISPFPAGAPLDMIARVVGEGMKASLGQPIIVENVAGAAGTLGVARAARAAADGYTVSIGNVSSHVLAEAIYPLSFDVLKDFEPVALLVSNPQVITSRNAVPAKDLAGLITWLRSHPDEASAGTAGPGSVSHVAGLFFQKETGTRFRFVPYRGINLAQRDLIGGQIDLLFDQASNALANVRAGNIRAYAVTAPARLDLAPEIPTVDEAGVPGLYLSVWSALWVPKGTPRAIITKLNAAAVAAMADPVVRTRLDEFGFDVPVREQQTPEALGALHKAEIEKWWPIIKAANIVVQ
jgi:tripartite-type tricarboxylate transporter receptor subunit TctC